MFHPMSGWTACFISFFLVDHISSILATTRQQSTNAKAEDEK